ncbi:MAG TPA: hypothetical protein VK789_28295 [Bryobacteraceae bacterium]|nr:hypothetical protein [Bryobacteraceae bacterium]
MGTRQNKDILQAISLADQEGFNRRLARTLKRVFPQLGTDDEMPGADTVEQLSELYDEALKGKVPCPSSRE